MMIIYFETRGTQEKVTENRGNHLMMMPLRVRSLQEKEKIHWNVSSSFLVCSISWSHFHFSFLFFLSFEMVDEKE